LFPDQVEEGTGMSGVIGAVAFPVIVLILTAFMVWRHQGHVDMVDEWEGAKMGVIICPTSGGPEDWPEDDTAIRGNGKAKIDPSGIEVTESGVIRSRRGAVMPEEPIIYCAYCGSALYAEDKKLRCASCGAPLVFENPRRTRERSIPIPKSDPELATEFSQ